jgi:nucleoside-diphosphate-sugar epimerase
MHRSVLIAGCGFVGLPLARKLLETGWQPHAITKAESSAERLRSESFNVHVLDLRHTDALRQLPRRHFNVVIHCASSAHGNIEDYRAVFFEGTKNIMGSLEYENFIFCSSTSVYAQADGGWVDESSAAEPIRETGQVLRDTEELVLAANGTVARLSGLYGPGRCVPLQKLLAGQATIEGDGTRVMNALHQLDAVGALHFLAATKPAGIVNVTDNLPVTQVEWYRYVCNRVHKPLPPTGPRNRDRKRGWTSKRVSNQRLRGFGWTPIYPTFKEGLETILASGRS